MVICQLSLKSSNQSVVASGRPWQGAVCSLCPPKTKRHNRVAETPFCNCAGLGYASVHPARVFRVSSYSTNVSDAINSIAINIYSSIEVLGRSARLGCVCSLTGRLAE